MNTTRAIKTRIYPTKAQKAQIDETIGSCRFVYNHMLERNIKAYRRRGEHLSYIDMQNMLPDLKKAFPWLVTADSKALQHACRHLDNALKAFFDKRAWFPEFKSRKRSKLSYETTHPIVIAYESGRVKLPKLGWIRHKDRRILPAGAIIASASVEKTRTGKYFVSVIYKFDREPAQIAPAKEIGLDYKSDGLFMDSDGYCCEMPKYFKASSKRLARLQRKLRHKKPGSSNHGKAVDQVRKLHEHIANQRKDFLHKKSTQIANEYSLVCIEDLDMKAISNKGFRNGRATMDNGWWMFTRLLSYKLEERDGRLVRIDRFYPSTQTCSSCGNRIKMSLSQRTYVCPLCGLVIDRDVNAAKNILAEGQRMLAST